MSFELTFQEETASTQLLFHHELVNNGVSLVITTGIDEVSWAYGLNVATFPTYGGEVVQILSVYIDDLTVEGTVRSYAEAEAIYEFFIKYFTVATQGSEQADQNKYTQVPMIMEYGHRGWVFEIQPLEAPGFTYATETVAPKWKLQAHVVDKTPDVKKLQDLVVQELVSKGETINGQTLPDEFLTLKGVISPESGDPGQNPFIAPGTFQGEKFIASTAQKAAEGVTKIGDYYNSLLPSYLNDTFFQSATAIGAKPNLGNEGEGKESKETVKGTPANVNNETNNPHAF